METLEEKLSLLMDKYHIEDRENFKNDFESVFTDMIRTLCFSTLKLVPPPSYCQNREIVDAQACSKITKDDVNQMSAPQMRKMLKHLGILEKGTKDELKQRLLDYCDGKIDPATIIPSDDSEFIAETFSDLSEQQIRVKKVTELRVMLQREGLVDTGGKKELVERALRFKLNRILDSDRVGAPKQRKKSEAGESEPSEKKKCIGKNSHGDNCNYNAAPGEEYCCRHNPKFRVGGKMVFTKMKVSSEHVENTIPDEESLTAAVDAASPPKKKIIKRPTTEPASSVTEEPPPTAEAAVAPKKIIKKIVKKV